MHVGSLLAQLNRQTCMGLHNTQTPVAGWLEAFAEHPRIGDVAGLKAKFGAFADLSRDEQSAAAASADDGVYEVRRWSSAGACHTGGVRVGPRVT